MNYGQHVGVSTQAPGDPSLQKTLPRLTDTLMAGNRRCFAAAIAMMNGYLAVRDRSGQSQRHDR